MAPTHATTACLLCKGVCPECGGYVGDAAGSLGWILCSMCHATFLHGHNDPSDESDGPTHGAT